MNNILHVNGRRLLCVAALAVLGGCASMDAKDCAKTDWYQRGLAEGRGGAHNSQIHEHAKVCAKASVVPDEAAWRAGHAEGLKTYCTAASGWNHGTRNETYRGACAGPLEPVFLRYHAAGQQLYKARQDLRQADERRKKIERDMNFTSKQDEKRRLREELKRADREHARLMALVAAHELAGPPR